MSDTLDIQGQEDDIHSGFSKAIDKIDHFNSISKLYGIGFSNYALALIAIYLNGRTLFIYYNGYRSKSILHNFAVSQ